MVVACNSLSPVCHFRRHNAMRHNTRSLVLAIILVLAHTDVRLMINFKMAQLYWVFVLRRSQAQKLISNGIEMDLSRLLFIHVFTIIHDRETYAFLFHCVHIFSICFIIMFKSHRLCVIFVVVGGGIFSFRRQNHWCSDKNYTCESIDRRLNDLALVWLTQSRIRWKSDSISFQFYNFLPLFVFFLLCNWDHHLSCVMLVWWTIRRPSFRIAFHSLLLLTAFKLKF